VGEHQQHLSNPPAEPVAFVYLKDEKFRPLRGRGRGREERERGEKEERKKCEI
jgi:hypothetical protein